MRRYFHVQQCRTECRVAMTSQSQTRRQPARRGSVRDKTLPPLQWCRYSSRERAAA
jgi:hypothetical protein